jgi:histidinol-phosphate/aromatic aminotransferase/cobyric acid decarboxylase-like protein
VKIRTHLFHETSHSPSLIDLVGVDEARTIEDFCFIANPYYPTPEMMQQLVDRFPVLIKSYPSSNPALAAARLGQVLRVDPDNLIVGNGASELITTMCDVIDSVAVPVPTFGEYLEKMSPDRLWTYPLSADDGYQLDLDAYLSWVLKEGAHAALVINPGNPTGQVFSTAEMEEFLQRAHRLDLVIVDESFIDFAGEEVPSLLPIADRYSNLIIVRSMSKHCGVPGLRLGYCYTKNPYVLSRLRRSLPTWNINTVAEYFLEMLTNTEAEYHDSRLRVMRDVQSLSEQLRRLEGFSVYPTGANFVLVRIDGAYTARDLQMALLGGYRLYVRDCTNKVGMDDRHIRIATQGLEADRRLINALTELSAQPARVLELAGAL